MLRRDEDGVASTVGTLFTLIIILMFLTAVIGIEDAHQADAEWGLVRNAGTSFATLRVVHDIQFGFRLVPASVGGEGTDGGVAVVLPVGMAAGNPFRRPVLGRLACDPRPDIASLGFSYRIPRALLDAVEQSDGTLSLHLAMNRIPAARYLWENGATLLVQGPNAVVVDYPYFRVEPHSEGVAVTYRAVRLSDDRWSLDGTGPEVLSLRAIAAESHSLTVAGGGEANLDEVQQFLRDLAREIYDASTDGSGRITGSYRDTGTDVPPPPNNPNPGILNQGLKEQLDYYNAALQKQESGDCVNAADQMNASARQLLDNTMDKLLEGIDQGFIDPTWGTDLHARMGTLHRCLDEMTGSLNSNCEFSCLSLFGESGGRLEFLISSDHRAAWGRWYDAYLSSAPLDRERWDIQAKQTFILVRIDNVKVITLEVAYVTFR
jgi:hypothetical protein